MLAAYITLRVLADTTQHMTACCGALQLGAAEFALHTANDI